MSYMGHSEYSGCGGTCRASYESPSAKELISPKTNVADYSLGRGHIPQYAGSDMGPAQSYKHDIPTIRILM